MGRHMDYFDWRGCCIDYSLYSDSALWIQGCVGFSHRKRMLDWLFDRCSYRITSICTVNWWRTRFICTIEK